MQTDSLLGKQLDEYRIDKALGTGGMARVYRALDVKLRRYVALKVIASNLRADSEYASRFEREAQSIARLEHPNIVHIYRFGEVGDLYYMAMQYIEGADLAWLIEDYRASGEVMPIADVARVVQDITSALDYAHGKGVIHRDVKPGNIMLDSQGRGVLTDFGLALLSDLGTQGEIFGTPHYLAPEQAVSSGKVVPQSDLYALGVTLFEMLTGELPFNGETPIDLAMQHMSDPPPRPSQLNPAIPGAVDDVVLRSLEKEPYDRYQTGGELNAAFQSAVAQWQRGGNPASSGGLRPSLVMIPQKVDRVIEASPLPEVPSSVAPDNQPTRPFAVPEMPPSTPSTPPPTPVNSGVARVTQVAPPKAGVTAPIAPPTRPAVQRTDWRGPLMLGVALFALGFIAMLLFFAATRRPGADSVAAVATTVEATTQVPATPVPPTLTPVPTLEPPTPTAVTLLQNPTAVQPPIPTNPPPISQPPADRGVVPPNSRRLGEFQVEGYCNSRGMGVINTNNLTDWACTNPANGAVMYTLGPADFDAICQSRYNDPGAFAIRDQQKPQQAYNWSCYDYLAPVAPTAIQVATPSYNTLMPRFNKDWVALVNVSSIPVSLGGVVFRKDDGSTLNATDWGRSVLMPGECLRLFKGAKPPKDLPQQCATAIDYAGPANVRDQWFTDKVLIVVNPSLAYCYPVDKCANSLPQPQG